MEIEIRNYENTNGKSPKGYGYWIFTNEDSSKECGFIMSYADAKKKARKWAKQENITKLYLKPQFIP